MVFVLDFGAGISQKVCFFVNGKWVCDRLEPLLERFPTSLAVTFSVIENNPADRWFLRKF